MRKNVSGSVIILLVLVFVIGSLLNPQSKSVKAASFKQYSAYITSYELRVRSKASNHFSVRKMLHLGDKVTVISKARQYTRVKYGRVTGYVQSRFLSRSKFRTYGAYITSYELRIRDKARAHFSTRKMLHMGNKVTVTGKWNQYTQVRYGKVTGYVQSRFLSRSKFRTYGAYITSYELRIRDKARAHFSTRKMLHMGNKVTVTGKWNQYTQVRYGKVTGYVQSRFLSRSKFRTYGAYITSYELRIRDKARAHFSTRKMLHMGNKVTVTGKWNQYTQVRYGKTVGYVQSKFLSRNQFKPYGAYVTSSELRLRNKPRAHFSVLKMLHSGNKVTVTGKWNQYSKVKYGSKVGYVQAKYLRVLRKVSYQVKLQPNRQTSFKAYAAYVTTNELNVRSSPTSAKSNKIALIKKNEKITVIGETGKWLKIKLSNGRVGYVSAGYIMKGTAPSKKPSVPPANTNSFRGVDISHWQSKIDFNAIKKEAGIRFVIVKATEGQTYRDSKFYDHVKHSQAAGLSTYAYHFLRADSTTEAVKEANFFVKTINGRISKNSYVFLDVEDVDGDPLTKDKRKLTEYINAFLNVLNQNGYHKFGVYTGFNFYYTRIDAAKLPNNTRLWIARYRYNREEGWDSTYKGLGMPADIWQFRSDGKIQGISGDVDINISYFTDALNL
ncbi:SH3 domain-containing protein [Sporolactobacillus terrae]|uniref:SH3b domain-containing protein n=1 Tax=Sporolactobacillus terrae TaxID=269673 RepID=A0A5K7WW42_9BACL|nr:SH3 domain-containing protein [Sporolactobacillus terrae]BBN97864.1 hypothetical protein St703_05690 [Sporolactobacillus terrae]